MGRALLLTAVLALAACGGGGEGSDLSGADLAADVGCLGCHMDRDTDIAPTLQGIWGTEVNLEDGSTVTVDQSYVRRSITEPGADIVEGYGPSMPTMPLEPEEVDRLVEWVESLG